MVDPVLKFPGSNETTASPAEARRGLPDIWRVYRRPLLLIVLPAIAVIVGLIFYLMGGRYISTDNAYVGAPKVLITLDVSGKIGKVVVTEGQHVKSGDALFEIDAEPYRLALEQAKAKLANAQTDFENLKSNDAALSRLIDLADQTVAIKKRDVERKSTLVANLTGSQSDLDGANAALVAAKNQLELLLQQRSAVRNRLLGDTNLPLDKFPPWMQAKAAADQAQRDLAHTVIRAPISGTATLVDNIQLGRFVTAGTPVLSVIDDASPWVDANPKETDMTYVRVGQKATITVDAFPHHVFEGTVASLSPGTGSQFAILPPQNASGNWVKVVQRVPLRVTFNSDEITRNLRAGMSASVSIDTGHSRSIGSLFGLAKASESPEP